MSKKPVSADKAVWAILVAKRLRQANTDDDVDPLHPIGKETPFAMTPICNIPLIDYVLECLVQNGIDQTFVLHDDRTQTISHHLSNVRSMRGKTWTESTEMKVVVVESVRQLTVLHEAASEVIDRNLVPESKTVLWIPIDALTNFSGLKEMMSRHLARVEKHRQYAATMIAASDPLPLRRAYEAASRQFFGHAADGSHNHMHSASGMLMHESLSQGKLHRSGTDQPSSPAEGGSPSNGSSIVTSEFPTEPAAATDTTDLHRMTVIYDHHGLVQQLHRHETSEEDGVQANDAFKIAFSKKTRLSVRSDLVFFGWCILSPGALGLFKFFMKDTFDFLTSIINNNEVEQNVFGIDITPPNTAVCSMNTLQGFLQTNKDVMARVLYPLTRESNFADQQSHYTVSHTASTVYVARSRDINSASKDSVRAHRSLGPYAVIGPDAEVPSSTSVRSSVLGKNVQLGKNCVIERCVLMHDVRIMDDCVIRDTVIDAYSVVGQKTHLSHCIIGSKVTLQSNGPQLVLEHKHIEHEVNAESEPLLVGASGFGHASAPSRHHTAVSLVQLFTRDPVPASNANGGEGGDDGEESDGEAPLDVQFMRALTDVVEVVIRSHSKMEHAKMEMRNLRTSYHRTNGDLAKAVIQLLLANVQSRYANHTPAEAYEVAFTLLQEWCKPFFAQFVTTEEDMGKVLEGLCLAISPAGSVLLSQAPKLMECLYNSCDDALYDEREYCVVSGKSLLTFDDWVQELEKEDPEQLDEEEKAVLKIGTLCVAFIEGVDSFLNGQ